MMENITKNVIVNAINNLIKIVKNTDPKNIILAEYDKLIDKHIFKFVDENNKICTITIETHNTNIKKLTINDRRALVQKLNEKCLSQTVIAKELNVDQKTISNDLKFLDKMKKSEEAFKPVESK